MIEANSPNIIFPTTSKL